MSTASLESFLKKYQTARSYNSKEIRLTITEAEELSTGIALAFSKLNTLQEKIIDLQNQLLESSDNINISGGGFR